MTPAVDEEGKIEQHTCPYSTGIDEEGYRGKRRLSSLTVNGSKINPLRTVAATNVSPCIVPNVQIIESSALKNGQGASAVKVVSVKAPNIGEASKRTATTQIQLARIEDVDMSGMKLIHRSVLKLRKWKALVLAEVPPMVEIETQCKGKRRSNTPSTNPLGHDAFVHRLKFANKLGGDRSVIDSEARSYSLSKRELVSQRQRKRKEFCAVPRSARASFYKPRSHTASV